MSGVEHTWLDGLTIEIQYKAIKHLYIRLLPPDGRIVVSAPAGMPYSTIEHALLQRKTWIEQKRQKIQHKHPKEPRLLQSGELHYLWGQAVSLNVIHTHQRARVEFDGGSTNQALQLNMYIRQDSTEDKKQALLDAFYRQELKREIPPLLTYWQPIIGDTVNDWGVKKMKTRWGSCNTRAKRIWLNSELAKKPPICLAYVLVHELVHLLEPSHNARFKGLMTQCMPDWKAHKHTLENAPV